MQRSKKQRSIKSLGIFLQGVNFLWVWNKLVWREQWPLYVPLKQHIVHVLTILFPSTSHRITELQNHRMVGVGRDLCRSSSPTRLTKQGHPEQAAQERIQAGLEYLQRRRLHSLPGQPVPGLCHPQKEEVLPHVQVELHMLQFVLVALCPVASHHWKESGPILLAPALQIFIGISKFPSQPSSG